MANRCICRADKSWFSGFLRKISDKTELYAWNFQKSLEKVQNRRILYNMIKQGRIAQLVRAPRWHRGGHRFEFYYAHHFCPLQTVDNEKLSAVFSFPRFPLKAALLIFKMLSNAPILTLDYGLLRNAFWAPRCAKSCYHTLQSARLSENYGILRNFSNHAYFPAKPHTGHTGDCNSILFSSGKELPRKKVQTLYTCPLHQHHAQTLSHMQKQSAICNTLVINDLRLQSQKINIY